MNYLIILLSLISTTLFAQDYGKQLTQYKYSAYGIEYHKDYDGPKEEDAIYKEDEYGEKQYVGPKYTSLSVTIYEYKVEIECKGRLGNSANGVYGKGDKITGPNWYGYELAGDRQLVISKMNARIYSMPEEIDGEEVFMMEEVFMNPVE